MVRFVFFTIDAKKFYRTTEAKQTENAFQFVRRKKAQESAFQAINRLAGKTVIFMTDSVLCSFFDRC